MTSNRALPETRLRGWGGEEIPNAIYPGASYAFESSGELPSARPETVIGDHSRLSCGAGGTQL